MIKSGDKAVTSGMTIEPTIETTTTAKPEAAKSQYSGLKSFVSGGMGGICAVIIGHPFDLIKVRMQTGAIQGTNVFGVLFSTLRREGVAGVYRGVSAPMLAVSPMFAVSFWGYDMGQQIVRRYDKSLVGGAPLTISQCVTAGAISAIPTTAIMAPSERIKCLLQIPNSGYNGFFDCAAQTFRQGGITSVYKGTVLTLMRDIPGSMAWFGTYEFAKLQFMRLQGLESTKSLSPLAVLTAGGLAGMMCWTVTIPMDVVKSRFQSAPEGTYTGIAHCFNDLIKTEGYGALIKGVRPALIRAFPANAACFFGMEQSKKYLDHCEEWYQSTYPPLGTRR